MTRRIDPRSSATSVTLVALLLAAAVAPARAFAAPFLPASDAQVLERLPWTPNDAAARLARARRSDLARDPRNLDLALAAAHADVLRARSDGDPRYLGYAQAALAPWWNAPEPPVGVRVLRATIRQSLHDFDAALDDLRAVLERDPTNVQAWITQAMIQQTRGDYADARRSCTRVLAVARRSASVQLAAVTCRSSVASFAGDARRSYDALREALGATDVGSDERVWPLGVLADIATRLGDVDRARAHYEEALALAPRDSVLRIAYADFLLDRREPAAVLTLLGGETANDGFLLRIALAENALGVRSSSTHAADLRARFAAAALRGDGRHLREEARFTLALLHDGPAALALAERDWAVQREPEDARVVLEAAIAVGDAATVDRVRAWVTARRLEDVRLTATMPQTRPGGGVGAEERGDA